MESPARGGTQRSGVLEVILTGSEKENQSSSTRSTGEWRLLMSKAKETGRHERREGTAGGKRNDETKEKKDTAVTSGQRKSRPSQKEIKKNQPNGMVIEVSLSVKKTGCTPLLAQAHAISTACPAAPSSACHGAGKAGLAATCVPQAIKTAPCAMGAKCSFGSTGYA